MSNFDPDRNYMQKKLHQSDIITMQKRTCCSDHFWIVCQYLLRIKILQSLKTNFNIIQFGNLESFINIKTPYYGFIITFILL